MHEVAGEDQVVTRAVQIARELAAKDRATLIQHKRLLYAGAIKACGA